MMTVEQVLCVARDIRVQVEPELALRDVTLDELQQEVARLQSEGAHLRVHATQADLIVEDILGKKGLRLSEKDALSLGKSADVRAFTLRILELFVPFRQEVPATGRPLADLADAFALVEWHDFPVEQVLLPLGGLAVLASDSQATFGPDTDNVWGATVTEVELPDGVLAVVVGEGADGEDKAGRFALVVAPL